MNCPWNDPLSTSRLILLVITDQTRSGSFKAMHPWSCGLHFSLWSLHQNGWIDDKAKEGCAPHSSIRSYINGYITKAFPCPPFSAYFTSSTFSFQMWEILAPLTLNSSVWLQLWFALSKWVQSKGNLVSFHLNWDICVCVKVFVWETDCFLFWSVPPEGQRQMWFHV